MNTKSYKEKNLSNLVIIGSFSEQGLRHLKKGCEEIEKQLQMIFCNESIVIECRLATIGGSSGASIHLSAGSSCEELQSLIKFTMTYFNKYGYTAKQFSMAIEKSISQSK